MAYGNSVCFNHPITSSDPKLSGIDLFVGRRIYFAHQDTVVVKIKLATICDTIQFQKVGLRQPVAVHSFGNQHRITYFGLHSYASQHIQLVSQRVCQANFSYICIDSSQKDPDIDLRVEDPGRVEGNPVFIYLDGS